MSDNVPQMNVLVIDDSPTNLALIKTYVRKIDGVNPIPFADPQLALEWLSEPSHQADLILVDYIMPHMNGLEFIEKFRAGAGNDEVPVVMITAIDERPVLYQALELGANDFLSKPVDEIELRARTKNMLKLRLRSLELRRSYADLQKANDTLVQFATIDSLTQVCNRRFFMESADAELSRARRYQTPVCVLMLDADHFKGINDKYGHAAGDDVLRAISRICKETVRDVDIVGRLGGEEFAMALPATAAFGGAILAERLRRAAETTIVSFEEQDIRFTVSLGLAQWNGEETLESLLGRADKALYGAKRNGRNQWAAADRSHSLG